MKASTHGILKQNKETYINSLTLAHTFVLFKKKQLQLLLLLCLAARYSFYNDKDSSKTEK